MKWIFLVLGCCSANLTYAQLKKRLTIDEATRLRKGEIVRYFKTRPHDIEKGLPYQVLIIVKPGSAIVKTNDWEFYMTLNEKQRASLTEDLSYLDYGHLNMFRHEKGSPAEERNRLLMYLVAKKGKQTIRWNSRTHDPRGATLLIETLEIYHYFGRQTMDKAK